MAFALGQVRLSIQVGCFASLPLARLASGFHAKQSFLVGSSDRLSSKRRFETNSANVCSSHIPAQIRNGHDRFYTRRWYQTLSVRPLWKGGPPRRRRA